MTHAATISTDGTKKINGRKIILKEFPEFDYYSYCSGWIWYICEYESGRAFGSGSLLRIAKEMAIKNITIVGVKKFRDMIKESIKQYGYANKRSNQCKSKK